MSSTIWALTDGTAAQSTDRLPIARSATAGQNFYLTPAYLSTFAASDTQTLTNKTFDTAGTGNTFKINGTTVSSVTGTGAAVLANSPTLTAPALGVATATSINKMAITAPATSSTLAVADGKTATFSNTITFAGTDSTVMTFPSTSATIARTDAANTFTGAQTISGGTLNGTVLDISQTWGGTGTYTGIKYNVTDSGPSNAASLLLDLQVGGSSQFKVSKGGSITFASNNIIFQGSTTTQLLCGATVANSSSSFGFYLLDGYRVVYDVGSESLRVKSNAAIGFSSSSSDARTLADTFITRAAAATLQHGAADAASPVAQTIKFQSSNSTNNSGADATFIASLSAGSGASGKIILKGGVTGAASGTTNTSVAALTITSGTTNNTNVGYPSVVVGAGAAVATNATDGFLYIPTCAGTPTGTPTSQTGAAPMVLDTTNSKFWMYTGGAWKGVTIA